VAARSFFIPSTSDRLFRRVEGKPHDLSTNTFINSTDPRVLKMAEEAMKNQQKSRQG